jgi:hypothetical protein
MEPNSSCAFIWHMVFKSGYDSLQTPASAKEPRCNYMRTQCVAKILDHMHAVTLLNFLGSIAGGPTALLSCGGVPGS